MSKQCEDKHQQTVNNSSNQSNQPSQSTSSNNNSSNDDSTSSESNDDSLSTESVSTESGPTSTTESESSSTTESESSSTTESESSSTTESESSSSSESESSSSSESESSSSSESESSSSSESESIKTSGSESSFSIGNSFLPDQRTYINEVIGEEQELLPPSEVTEKLTLEIISLENDLQVIDNADSILAEDKITTTDILDSLGDTDTVALDSGPSDQLEKSGTTDSSWSGHGQTQQLLLEPTQEQEQDHLIDDQELSDTTEVDNSEITEQDQQPITEDELTEQERLGQEFCDNKTNTSEPLNDQVIADKSYTHEKFDQLVRDYQTSLEQRAALEEDSSSNEQQEADLDQQTATTCDNVINEVDENIDSDTTQQEGVYEKTLTLEQEEPQNLTARDIEPSNVTESYQQTDREESINELERPIQEQQLVYSQDAIVEAKSNSIMVQVEQPLVIESETPHTVEDLLPQTDFPSYFSTQETISTQLFSELCLMEDSLESVSDDLLKSTNLSENSLSEIVSESPSLDLDPKTTPNLFQDLKPEILSIEDYLSSIDSPRLLEQFHTQMQEETTQLFLIDDSQSLPNLEGSLELVSKGPTIPDPPPYDFLQDLEEQEEANQRSSSTRSHLLWSLKQARLKQEVANYQFALRNLPIVKNQIQRDVQKADLPKSPSSELIVKANKQATNSRKSTRQREEVSNTLDTFLIPQTQTQSQTNEISSERGIWGHLSIHIPLLGRAGTDKFLDSLIQSRQQEHDILIAITDKSWSLVKEHMLHYAYQKDVNLDAQIMDTIINWSENQLSIQPDTIQEGTKWVITRVSIQQEYTEETRTEIVFKPTGWHEERLKEIKTISMNQIQPQINFVVWMFRSYQNWNQLISGGEESSINNKGLLKIPTLITEYDQENNSLFKMCHDIFPNGKRPNNPQYVKWKQNQRIKDEKMFEINTQRSQETKTIQIQMKSLWNNEENIWLIEAPIREDIYDSLKLIPREKNVQALLSQERVTEGLISYERDLNEEDSIFLREQVSTVNLPEVSRNIPRVHIISAEPDTLKYRKPDRVALILRNKDTRPEIEIILIEEKLSIKGFDVSSNDKGNGRAQPLRDSLWFIVSTIKGCKEYFPNIREEDIKISCYIVTARVDKKDMIVIEGEELFRRIPASHVLPYSGLIIRSDRELYDLLDHMKTSYNQKGY